MTATEVLRRLLDERGVEYEADDDVTRFFDADGVEVVLQENMDGKLDCLTPLYLTPEQAIAATLGSCSCSNGCTNGERMGTCRIDLVGYNQREDRFQCRSCDWSMWFKRGTWPRFNYCPNCGARCVG